MPTDTDMYVDPRVARTDTGDGEKFTHVVRGLPGQDTQEMVRRAYANGTVLIALCGHRWIPTSDPRKHPVCQACMQQLQSMRGGA